MPLIAEQIESLQYKETATRRFNMRWLLSIVGIVLALLGTLWILQGTNIIRTGFMAGIYSMRYSASSRRLSG
jgi:uncharacterized integral membrane protein